MVQASRSQKSTWKYELMVQASRVHKNLHLKSGDNLQMLPDLCSSHGELPE